MSQQDKPAKVALVTVFEDLPAAAKAVAALQVAGFEPERIELVTYGVAEQTPELDTPLSPQSTFSEFASEAEKWGLVGLEAGALAGVVAAMTTFPGLALGMIIAGGLTGGIVGGMAGIEKAVLDDRINLPSPEDYEKLLNEGKKLVVVLGTHEEVAAAKDLLAHLPSLQGHLHPIWEHQFHEHPARDA
jgi:hypothetical protein